ncbi:TPA: glycoside hydrolase family protein [Pseudomonas aeruginosa]|nr:glycoside hydrolase family protein [Pseudomonas aeruginosa]
MASRKSYLSAAVLALVAAGASSSAIMDRFLLEQESSGQTPLRAYQDGARIWTVCDGKTEAVTRSTVMTQAECDAWRKTEIGRRLTFVHSIIRVPMSEPAWAGVGSWCFNVGNSGCAGSTAVKLLNQGNQPAGCRALLRWHFITRDGRKIDCSTPQPYCGGLWDRRQAEAELCAL